MKVYFIYSSEQYYIRKEADSKMGKEYKPPKVLVSGKYKPYTEIVTDPNKMTYRDRIVVTSRDKSRIKIKK